ncbi:MULTISPECIES: radical SAM family heme chaperone HemW [Corynebacterium]|uniref:Heme chaperone HemW n=1 Tax=Corynebacterium amycolatum TaxID=43765 RepID=A0AB38XUC7_CORAY|nr:MULTISPECIES: radical SAM family heme chaperone HemW [Corynebacterium]MBC6757624.1 coproporphyrinogen III oxidase [Corynebacterium sp. LK24]AIN82186.1 radical SAM superfamily protein [Corynebacterium sp. ATCC 6931]KAA9289906.1 coproporphyrinogen III oxidase [Corynebacterium amycolatum]MBC6725306.1 coproporphyrinogen III oxidase [Corynebacterium amycolatum]MCT1719112.1 radical SAM family heme chaperone HemW [Corynebacterium amycolatum]
MSEASAHTDSFGVYLHVPFCATRCGYCDFNTYTPGQLGSGETQGDYLDAIVAELEMAVVKHPELARGADTVFVGGGTPSMLGASGLRRLLDGVRNSFGLADDAEVTTESNPESTSPEFFEGLAEAGFTRVSLGMQSAVPHVLATLDRTHTPGRPAAAVAEARAAGFEHINLDVIYGTPGESMADLDTTLEAVLATEVDHVSAYSLIVEPGTAMARKVRRGELPMPDDDDLADRYERIDAALSQVGFSWYEVSNWAKPGGQCRHNMLYWRDGNWWGAGPGAHSHLDGTRFYNVKHPARYAATISGGELPIKDSEGLTAEDRHTEKIMLGLRLAEGIDANLLGEDELDKARRQAEAGMVEFVSVDGGQRIQLTNRGRLLADAIIVDILS